MASSQSGSPRFTVTMSARSATVSAPLSMTARALNADGSTNTSYTGTVQLTSTDYAFTPGIDYRYTFTVDPRQGDNGQHVFTVNLNTTGSHSITATDTANGAMTGTSPTVTVTAATGARFTVTSSATTTTVGAAVQMTVTARAADGTVNTRYIGNVLFSSSDAAFAPGTAFRYTFIGADQGVHTFSITFNTAGSQTITATDTTTSTITGTSPAAAVAETVLSATFAAGSMAQGTAVNLTVQAKTSGGALVSGYRGTVRLSSTWNGVLSANWGTGVDPAGPSYTFTATDAGSHIFTPKFDYTGDQTVTVTDVALAARTVTSGIIAVTNAPAASFAHASAPAA